MESKLTVQKNNGYKALENYIFNKDTVYNDIDGYKEVITKLSDTNTMKASGYGIAFVTIRFSNGNGHIIYGGNGYSYGAGIIFANCFVKAFTINADSIVISDIIAL